MMFRTWQEILRGPRTISSSSTSTGGARVDERRRPCGRVVLSAWVLTVFFRVHGVPCARCQCRQ